jgi:hypothetical protein
MSDKSHDDGEQEVSREALQPYAAGDPIVQRMLDNGLPLARNTYVTLAYGGDEPEVWNAEHEAQLPEPFQRLSE